MKKIILGLAGMVLVIGLMVNISVAGTTLYVDNTNSDCSDTNGTPYCTIQAAIDAASDGDIIIVADGTYTITAAINVNKMLTITGNVANPDNVVVQYSPASTSLNGFEIGAADITIQGFKIIDCFRGVHFGRSDVTSTGCTIINCVFDNNHENAIGEVAAENTTISNNAITNCNMGIEIRLNEATSIAKRTEVTGNTISSCSQSCIQTYGGKYVYIYGNTISNTNDKGINIIGSSATSSNERIQVISNDISGTIWDGIQLTKSGSYYPKYVYIHGNTISDTHAPGISVREVRATGIAERVEVSGNTISNTYFEGITVQYSSPYTYVHDNTLTGCNYYDSDGTGDWDYASIHVEDSDGYGGSHHTVIDSNTISDGINGIQTWSDDVTITNNEIYSMGNTYADTKLVSGRTYKNSGILIGTNWATANSDPTGVVIEHNNIYDNYWGIFYSADLMNGVTAENNWWGHASGPSGPDGRTNKTGKVIGKGDAVSANVDWNPWLPQPVGHTPHHLTPPGLPKHNQQFGLSENASYTKYHGNGIYSTTHLLRKDDLKAKKAKPDKTTDPRCYKLMGVEWTTTPDYVAQDADLLNIAEVSIGTWNDETNFGLLGAGSEDANAPFDYFVEGKLTTDGKNSYTYGDYSVAGVIAVCRTWYDINTNEIIEYDIMFDTDFVWGDATDPDTLDVMDLQNIATHEIGHGLGLLDVYKKPCGDVTMFGYSGEGDIEKRTLEPQDIAGLQSIYGN